MINFINTYYWIPISMDYTKLLLFLY